MDHFNSAEDTGFSLEIKNKEIASSATVLPGDDGRVVMNGYSNGYDEKHIRKEHKTEHKDKHRDKERDREKYKEKHKEHRDKDKDRERDKDKDKDRERDKEKDRHKEKDKHSSSSGNVKDKDKHNSSSSASLKDKDRKYKDEKKHHDKEREHKSSSSNKEKEHKSSSSSGKDRDKEKHSSSSSGIKDKDRHSSSHKDKEHRDKDKHSSSSNKERSDKDKHSSSSKNRDRHKESSSLDKEKKHSSDKDKDRHKEKAKERSQHDKEKDRNKEKLEKEATPVKKEFSNVVVKKEIPSFEFANVVMKKEFPSPKKETISSQSTTMKEEKSFKPDKVIKQEPEDDSFTDVSHFNSTASLNTSQMKTEPDSDDDVPLAQRSAPPKIKRKAVESDDDDIPLVARKKLKKEGKKKLDDDYDDEDFKPAKKKIKKKKERGKVETIEAESPRKRQKKEQEEHEVWKWWEEEKKDGQTKWNYLEHRGPVFAPPYERIPKDVKFFYDGQHVQLTELTEEVASFYARMLDHDYTTKSAFNTNFFKDWRKCMTDKEKALLIDLSKCNFSQIHKYFKDKAEERKQMTKEEKKKIKEQNEVIQKEYGVCVIDGHNEKIGNFKIEPPGLFRGRGEHPKMGMLKRRVMPEDVIINCSKDAPVPKAPDGHRWKEVRHDNKVTWLASWTENVQGQVKYVMLNPSSKLKGEKDWQKYETARKLAKSVDKIREEYRADWKSKEMRIRQRAVALYFIDKLALRAGNEKDEDQADTVGCCSLRVEHIQLHEEKDGKQFVVVFDFLGKDSIRYYNEVPVEKRVFKNLQLFVENKKPEDDLFDRLNTGILNKHLNELMEGLSAKVFRTFNASWTLQQQLKQLTDPEDSVPAKILSYNRANRAVAILCNHQRSVPKTHEKAMENLKNKINDKRQQLEEAEKQYKQAKRAYKNTGSQRDKMVMDKKKKAVERIKDQLTKLEVQATDKEENKEIALGTSKLNYLDPRISVAWCKKNGVPIDKIYNKTQREKFRWAIDMAGPEFIF